MASGRFLAASVSEDFRLNSLSLEAHLVFLMAIPHLDVDGIMAGHPTLVYAKACPLKPELLARMPDIIQEWVTAGLVVRYECDNEDVLFFTGFAKNQKVRRDREGKSRFDLPPGWARDDSGAPLRENSRRTPGVLPANSGLKQSKANNTNTTTSCAGVDPHSKNGSSRSSGADDVAQALIGAWRDNQMPGGVTGQILKDLRAQVEAHGLCDVLAAIVIAGEQDKRTLAYVKGVLKNGINSRRNGNGSGASYTDATLIPDGDDDDE